MQKHKSITRYLILFFLLYVVTFASAAPVGENTAKKIAARFAASFSPLRSTAQLSLVYTGERNSALRAGQDPLFYIYNVDTQGGFVIVSGDDIAHPILGYAASGTFVVDNMPENLSAWLDFYKEEMLYGIEQGVDASPEIRAEWQNIMLATKATVIDPGVEIPTALWDQTEPYNDNCPLDNKGLRSVSGCVATAMAIAMHHHQWPLKGTGRKTYTTRTSKKTLTAIFDTEYDWDNLPAVYELEAKVPTWSDEEAEAVATLMYDCGVAVEMDYTSSSSGAYTQDVIPALCDYFGYDNATVLRSRKLYTTAEWQAMMKKEIDENRPVIYGGQTASRSGHQFILDGYAETANYFRINWGWSGYANGYYLLSSLAPTQEGTGGSGGSAGYNYTQDAIIGLQKAKAGSKINNELYFLNYNPSNYTTSKPKNIFGIYSDVEHIVVNEPFLFYFSAFYDYGYRDFTGKLGVFLEDKNENRKAEIANITIVGKDGKESGLSAGYVLYDDQGMELTITEKVEEGDRIRLYYKPDGHDWRQIRGETTNVTETLAVYAESPVSNLSLQAEETVEVFPKRVDAEVTVRTSGSNDIQRITLYNPAGRLLKSQSVQNGKQEVSFSLTGQQPGLYILSVQTSRGESSHKIIKE